MLAAHKQIAKTRSEAPRCQKMLVWLGPDVLSANCNALTGPLKKLGIKGRGGRVLAHEWEDGPQTYLGVAITGYPNLFTITGPQSSSVLSNMPVSIEQHVEWITECIAHMRRNKLSSVEATPQAQDEWGAHVAEVVNATLMTGANSWYMGANIEALVRKASADIAESAPKSPRRATRGLRSAAQVRVGP
jgi:cation diffusion facilitator CzcD-associated flavoprotein CzcO